MGMDMGIEAILKSTFLKITLAFGTGGGEAKPAALLALAAVAALSDFSSRCGYAKRTPDGRRQVNHRDRGAIVSTHRPCE